MISIDTNNLNNLENEIYERLLEYSKTHPKFKIEEAAHLCGCSTSKISKFVKKIGFTNFKQYLEFLYGENIPVSNSSSELNRIKTFIENFDKTLVTDFLNLIHRYEKIIFFGYGPSLLCANYFEYRLRTCSNKVVMAVSDEISIASMIDKSTLIVILTVTGTFHSFEQVYIDAKSKGCEVAMIVEEYNTTLFNQCDKIFWLSNTPQPNYLKPYEKSRTIFFIFLEEIILQLQESNRKLLEGKDFIS